MRSRDCVRIRAAFRSGLSPAGVKPHLFRCASCRTEARLAAAWRSLGPRPEEAGAVLPDAFVERVLYRIRGDAVRRSRRLLLAAAAALLLFCVGAGASLGDASRVAAEDAYSRLTTPSTLEGLLPD